MIDSGHGGGRVAFSPTTTLRGTIGSALASVGHRWEDVTGIVLHVDYRTGEQEITQGEFDEELGFMRVAGPAVAATLDLEQEAPWDAGWVPGERETRKFAATLWLPGMILRFAPGYGIGEGVVCEAFSTSVPEGAAAAMAGSARPHGAGRPAHTAADGLRTLRSIARQLGSEDDRDSERCIVECCEIIEEALAAGRVDDPETLRLDLADARRDLARADGLIGLASALVSHGDAAGFDASVFEDCSPGFRDDFHALRRAVANRGGISVAVSPDNLRLVSADLTDEEVGEIRHGLNRRADAVPVDDAVVRRVWQTAVFVSGRKHPDLEVLRAERLRHQGEVDRLDATIDAMGDYVSHHGDWRRACEIARDAAGPSGVDHDDRGYWQHQLDTLDRIAGALKAVGGEGRPA